MSDNTEREVEEVTEIGFEDMTKLNTACDVILTVVKVMSEEVE